jgi:hypothetical protein
MGMISLSYQGSSPLNDELYSFLALFFLGVELLTGKGTCLGAGLSFCPN